MATYEERVKKYLTQDYRDQKDIMEDAELELLTDEEVLEMNPVDDEDLSRIPLPKDYDIEDEYLHLQYEKDQAQKEYDEEKELDNAALSWEARVDHRQDMAYARQQLDLAEQRLRKYINSEEFQKSSQEYTEGMKNAGRGR